MGSELHRFGIDEGQAPDARQWKQLCKLLTALITNPHLNVGSNQSEIVFPVTPAGRGRGGVSAAELKPLTLKNGTAVDKFQVIPGYVNSLMPTLSSTALDAETPPEITVTADVWVWIKCVGTFGTGSFGEDEYTITIETSASSVVPSGTAISSTGFTSFRCVGKVDYTAAAGGDPATYVISNFHNGGNLGVESFGNVNLWWLS
jgi:hypothetical protein